MDKNSIIGFVLIGLVLIGFTYLNRPSPEQVEAQRRYRDSMALVQYEQQQSVLSQQIVEQEASFSESALEGLSDSVRQVSLQNNFGAFASAATGNDEIITLENNNIEVKINSKGGAVSYARVKDYVTYEKEPLVLFEGGDSKFNITFVTATNRVVNTSDLYFIPVKSSSQNSVIMRLNVGEGGIVDFVYTLNPDDYMLNFTVKTSGLNGVLTPSTNEIGRASCRERV